MFFLTLATLSAAAQSTQLRKQTDSTLVPQKNIHPELTREILEYYQKRQGKDAKFEIINSFSLDSLRTRVQVACTPTDTLRQILTLDIRPGNINLPLFYDTRNCSIKQASTIRYHYDHDFAPKSRHRLMLPICYDIRV